MSVYLDAGPLSAGAGVGARAAARDRRADCAPNCEPDWAPWMAAMSSPLRILAVPGIPRSPAICCSSGSSLPDRPVPRRRVDIVAVSVATPPSELSLLSLTKGPSLERYAAVWAASRNMVGDTDQPADEMAGRLLGRFQAGLRVGSRTHAGRSGMATRP